MGNSSDELLLLSISLDEWLKNYSTDPNSALVALANCLVAASGLKKVNLDLGAVRGDGDEDPLDELLNEARAIRKSFVLMLRTRLCPWAH